MENKHELVKLSTALEVVTDKVFVSSLSLDNYVSTENMIPNFGGVVAATSLPSAIKTSSYQQNDILFSNIRTYFKKLWLANKDGGCSNDVIVFRVREGILPKFAFYSLMSDEFISYTVQTSKGTKMPRGDKNAIAQYELSIPSLKDQHAIAHILGTLDDKIELNRQMNVTLEAMAQALFKSWFVDFDPVIDNALAAGNPIPEPLKDRAKVRAALGQQRKSLPEAIQTQFPDRFVFNEDMGWVPDGWEVSPLDSLIELIGGGTPKTSIEEYWDGDLPWFSVVDAPYQSDVFVIKTEKNITSAGIENSSAKLLPVGTTIISARGTVGKCAVVGKPMAMNQSCYGIRGASGYGDYFTYYTVMLRVADLQQRSHGSVFSTITRDTFRTIKTVACPIEFSLSFEQAVNGYMSKILLNLRATSSLEKLRDTLLPKLLSGQLSIPYAEKLLAEAI